MEEKKQLPQIRFKGYVDAWEQCKLSELGEILTGYTPPTSNTNYYSEDGIPWVTPTDIESLTISAVSYTHLFLFPTDRKKESVKRE